MQTSDLQSSDLSTLDIVELSRRNQPLVLRADGRLTAAPVMQGVPTLPLNDEPIGLELLDPAAPPP